MRVFHRFVIAAILYVITPMNANPQNIPPKQASSNVDKSAIASLNSRVQTLTGSANRWNTWYLFSVFVAVVVGAATLVFQYMALKKGRELSDAQAQLIELKDSSVAGEFKDKDLKIAQAMEGAATAKKVAEEERLKRIKIEEKMADRRLSPDQRRIVRDKMRGFPPQSWQSITSSNDGEARGLGSDIEEALSGAGWPVPRRIADQTALPIRGVVIEFGTGANSTTQAAADALAKALRSERLEVIGPKPFTPLEAMQIGPGMSMSLTFGGKANPNAPITVLVGRKP
jgi:hypothetical protein